MIAPSLFVVLLSSVTPKEYQFCHKLQFSFNISLVLAPHSSDISYLWALACCSLKSSFPVQCSSWGFYYSHLHLISTFLRKVLSLFMSRCLTDWQTRDGWRQVRLMEHCRSQIPGTALWKSSPKWLRRRAYFSSGEGETAESGGIMFMY